MSDEREMIDVLVRAVNDAERESDVALSTGPWQFDYETVLRKNLGYALASPQFARLIAAAKAEVLREAAHEVRHSVMPHHPNAGYRDGHEHSAWVVESLADAALTAEPVATEGEGAGECPDLALRWGSASCDLRPGHEGDHRQKSSGRTWTTAQAVASWQDDSA